MKNRTMHVIVTAAIALAVSGIARADKDDNKKECSEATLSGLYIFNASGFNIVSGVAQPKAVVEFIRFNGDGSLTVPAATASINGVVMRSPAHGTGTYTVGADCTGSLTFGPPGPVFDLFLSSKGSEVYMIQIAPGSPVMQGIVEKLSN